MDHFTPQTWSIALQNLVIAADWTWLALSNDWSTDPDGQIDGKARNIKKIYINLFCFSGGKCLVSGIHQQRWSHKHFCCSPASTRRHQHGLVDSHSPRSTEARQCLKTIMTFPKDSEHSALCFSCVEASFIASIFWESNKPWNGGQGWDSYWHWLSRFIFGVATSPETNPGDRSSETTNAVQENNASRQHMMRIYYL